MAVPQERTEYRQLAQPVLQLTQAQYTCSAHTEHLLILFLSVRLA